MRKMRGKHIIGAIIVLIVGVLLFYMGMLTYLQYQDSGEMDWPLVLRGKGYSGTIVAVDENSIELEAVNGKRQKFTINKGTRIMLGYNKLEKGLFVKVIYKATKQMNIAKAIRKVKAPAGDKTTPEPEKTSPEESSIDKTVEPEKDADKPDDTKPGTDVKPPSDDKKMESVDDIKSGHPDISETPNPDKGKTEEDRE